jgi:hypothetical protein
MEAFNIDAAFLGVSILFLWIGAFVTGCALAYGACWLVNKFIHKGK